MIGVDTNILVHAHRRDSAWFEAASHAIKSIAESPAVWGIPWPCVHEFLAVVTHPRVFRPASTLDEAIQQVESWLASPSLALLGESDGHWHALSRTLVSSGTVGPKVHDTRIATICLEHGVDELWSADRDFSRFGALRVRNPLVGSAGEAHKRRPGRYGRRRPAR